MFRPMRRLKQELSKEECHKVLAEAKRGVLAVNGDEGYPYCVPMNFYYDEEENTLYLHGSKQGHRTESLRVSDKVCFTAYDEGYHQEGDWAWTLHSVVLFGRAELVDDVEVVRRMLYPLARRYYPSEEEIEKEISADLSRVQLIAIHVKDMKGKRVHEK